jgi:hypothetical protein
MNTCVQFHLFAVLTRLALPWSALAQDTSKPCWAA